MNQELNKMHLLHIATMSLKHFTAKKKYQSLFECRTINARSHIRKQNTRVDDRGTDVKPRDSLLPARTALRGLVYLLQAKEAGLVPPQF